VAVLDREREVVVIRVVYDGPPEAGKTTSLRALAGSLGQNVSSPAEEYGRTLYFDWMDYTAGRFDGYQIRCQIVSVPGQAEFYQRRWRLVKDADVVVFVGDSTRARAEESAESLRELTRFLARTASPPVGVIFQANKRDLPSAVPIDEMRQLITGGPPIAVIESVASDGTGIRESFVFAVRLALDRVREQLQTNSLPVGKPDVDTSAALLDSLRRREGRESLAPSASSSHPSAPPLLKQVLAENEDPGIQYAPWRDVSVAVPEDERPRSPDPSAPSGSIWPPVEGRMILQEAASKRMSTHRLRGGGWTAGLGIGWRIFSEPETVYTDVEAGRKVLVQVARMHVACKGLLSVNRCVVLAATGQGTWRLWQIVRAEKPLRDRFNDIGRCTTDEAASRIVDAASVLCEIGARLQAAPCNLPCTLDTIGFGESGPVYVGLMPMESRSEPSPDVSFAIGSQLAAILKNALHERRSEVLATVARLLFHSQSSDSGRVLDEVLTQMAAS
jgi:signal recognition particle receptor subunit beta